jgi:hypothetical protein
VTVSGARRTSGRRSRADLAVGGLLFALGLAYGTWAVYLVPFRLWDGLEGLSLVVTVAGNLLVGWLSVWCLQYVKAALWPVAGWLVATGAMALVVGPGGDIVVPGGLPYDPGVPVVGELNWLAGLISAGLALVVGTLTAGGGFTRRVRPPT